jgi:hypothetical protein
MYDTSSRAVAVAVTMSVNRALGLGVSALQDNPERLARALTKTLTAVATIAFPFVLNGCDGGARLRLSARFEARVWVRAVLLAATTIPGA